MSIKDFCLGFTKPIRDGIFSYGIMFLIGNLPSILLSTANATSGLPSDIFNSFLIFVAIFGIVSIVDDFFMAMIWSSQRQFDLLSRCFGILFGTAFLGYFLSGYINDFGGVIFEDLLFVGMCLTLSIVSCLVRQKFEEPLI